MHRATATEDLAAIRALMSESQSFLSGTWRHQMVWGMLGSAGLVATWMTWRSETYGLIGWIWAAVVGSGWTYSLVLSRRGAAQAPVRNVASRAFGGIWMALGVSVTLLGALVVVTGAMDPRGLPGVIAIVFGAGYFASGLLAEMRWLMGVAVAWWMGGVGLLVWSSPHALLALAAMMVLLEVGPAIVLRRQGRASSL